MTRPGNDIDEFLTPDRLQQLDAGKDNLRRSGFLTDEKLRSIINYLDEVETADRISDIDQVGFYYLGNIFSICVFMGILAILHVCNYSAPVFLANI